LRCRAIVNSQAAPSLTLPASNLRTADSTGREDECHELRQ